MWAEWMWAAKENQAVPDWVSAVPGCTWPPGRWSPDPAQCWDCPQAGTVSRHWDTAATGASGLKCGVNPAQLKQTVNEHSRDSLVEIIPDCMRTVLRCWSSFEIIISMDIGGVQWAQVGFWGFWFSFALKKINWVDTGCEESCCWG